MKEIFFELDCSTEIPHFHDEMEILYVLSGRAAVVGSGYNYVLNSEDFIVFNPYDYHEMYVEKGGHTLSCYISHEILEKAELGQISCCSVTAKGQKYYYAEIRTDLAMLFDYYREFSEEYRCNILSQIFDLFAIMKAQFEQKRAVSASVYKDTDRIREVLAYLGDHFSEKITIQDVADHVYVSKSHLSREFQKWMKVSFSDYLRKLRLSKSRQLLLRSDKTIAEIALECGFSNSNTFILNFRQEYSETPGIYRKKNTEMAPEHPRRQIPENLEESPMVSYLGLLKYAARGKEEHTLKKKQQAVFTVRTSLLEDHGQKSFCHNDTINIGWANSLMTHTAQVTLKRAIEEVGFRYVRFHGALDDSMDLYHELPDGTKILSFTYLDIIIDAILDFGGMPFFEFSYTPRSLVTHVRNIFGNSCINLPDTPEHLAGWQFIVENVMLHLLARYGKEEVVRWRFSAQPANYISYGVFSLEMYLNYYRLTYESVHRILPEAQFFGFGLDTGYLALDGSGTLEKMLDYCREADCLPQAFLFHCFGCDYSQVSRSDVEENISEGADIKTGEPAPPSRNPDVLRDEINSCMEVLRRCHLSDRPVYVSEWNSTIWQHDLCNDTCFKSAFVVKNILENCEGLSGIFYTHLTDNSERLLTRANLFHGGYGLFTYNGIPKAVYYAYQLLTWFAGKKGTILAQGKGYLITRSENRKQIQIMLYNYCHFDLQNRITYALPREEQRSINRYYCFERKGARNVQLHLADVPKGNYLKRSISITPDYGSSYDQWMSIGAPELKGQEQLDYLDNISACRIHYEALHVTDSEELELAMLLNEHEVCMIFIEQY